MSSGNETANSTTTQWCSMSTYGPLILSILIPEVASALLNIGIRNEIDTWYNTLKKPSFNPPSWVFAPVWITIYFCMGVASYLVWLNGGGFNMETVLPLSLYGLQLLLNLSWSPIFFREHLLGLSVVVIVLLWVSIVATIPAFYTMSTTAAYLLVPHLLWVSFASVLDYSIWKLNRTGHESEKKIKF